MIARLLTLLLGPHCPHGCGQRLYPRDVHTHLVTDHAGDPDVPQTLIDAVRDPHVAAAYLRRHRTTSKQVTRP
ncbi:hypothetical protein [Nocardioides pakistanensis]